MFTPEQLKNYMTLADFERILHFINTNHSSSDSKGKRIKYIEPSFDFRTQRIFHVKLRKGTDEKHFSVTNENKDKQLFDWIIDWLDNGSWT